ncbi:hypothetical protein APHAL10511_008263 [Amanita phalloides]|nr:hypothetical protein APHAL10511_008263 [Amanita phalloides]
MLLSVTDWENFSNHGTRANRRVNSLEGIHDNIHVVIGGILTVGGKREAGGHMSAVPYSAFDPIFYLHHTTIDRLLSLWSALNQGAKVPPSSATNALTPFRMSGSAFWASTNLYNRGYHNTESLGYSYPGMRPTGTQPSGPSAQQQQAANMVPPLPIDPDILLLHPYRIAAKASVLEYLAAAEIREKNFFNLPENQTNGLLWSVRIRVKKFEVGGSFSVLVFLGAVPEPSDLLTSGNLVGINSVFANVAVENCENCQNNIDMIHEGFIHLNSSLAQHALGDIITTSDPEDARNRLTAKLNYYVISAEGHSVQLRYFETTVIRTEVSDPSRHKREELERNYSATGDKSTSNISRLFSALEESSGVLSAEQKPTFGKVARLYSTEYESYFNESTGRISTTSNLPHTILFRRI